ncbi:MAG TPA: hypothetical protein DCX07_07105 [Phycisphaerales bacterium]|nr:hypothetical protein [Phycisphaerales bacterium]
MTAGRLILRTVWHYRAASLSVAAGAAVTAVVLVGALTVGDSVRHTLRHITLQRLGETELVLNGERLIRAALADELAASLRTNVAPALMLRGVASRQADGRGADDVRVIGADARFWSLAGRADPLAGRADAAAVNTHLARRLGCGVGDRLVLRVERPALMPREAPLSVTADVAQAITVTVAAVVDDENLGRFSLLAGQLPPDNVFLPLAALAERIARPGRANTLLVARRAGGGPTPAEARAALAAAWQLADADLELRALPQAGAAELRTGQIFLDAPVSAAVRAAGETPLGVLTYFVNELRVGDRAAPYSMVAALGPLAAARDAPPLPPGLRDDQAVINRWLADDLGAAPGDALEMRYFALTPAGRLVEQSARFTVAAVVPLNGPAADATLMPAFPGLAEHENCRDWSPGVPVDLARIRPKDQDYWTAHRGTPKAFVTLRAGQALWANRFGDLTAVRWPLADADPQRLAEALRAKLDPAAMGLRFAPVRQQALAAGEQAIDFGQLFLGLSAFLIVSAVLLTALLFALGVRRRRRQIGTLLALGYWPGTVRRLLLAEGFVLAAVGALVGAGCGLAYTRAVLGALATVWSGAVAGAAVRFHASSASVALGTGGAIGASVLAIWLTLRREARKPVAELLAGEGDASPAPPRRAALLLLAACLCGLAAGGILVSVGTGRTQAAAEAFFAAGALLLVALLTLTGWWLGRLLRKRSATTMTLAGLAAHNAARRRARSLAVVALLACGCFLVVAVGANRRDVRSGALGRASGTGGFSLWGESALPVYADLSDQSTLSDLAPDAPLENVSVVPLRVREGDDASCLNLNRAQTPAILGVRPAELADRNAFTFVKLLDGTPSARAWLCLDSELPDGQIPAVADETTVTYGLGKKLGDTLEFTDDAGATRRLRIEAVLAGSILQGSLLISETNFRRAFPDRGGFRAFLVDAPPERRQAAAEALRAALVDAGLRFTPAPDRLAAFQTVENTYLAIFQALGGLGLILGSAGLAVVVARNVTERRAELALLRAVGLPRSRLVALVFWEHAGLVALGLACGTTAALLAVAPALASPAVQVPYRSLGLTLTGIAVSGLLWTLLAAWGALRGPLLGALREE